MGKVLTPHAPITRDDNLLIECAKHDFKIMYFPFLIFLYFFGVDKGMPLLLRILKCDKEFRPT